MQVRYFDKDLYESIGEKIIPENAWQALRKIDISAIHARRCLAFSLSLIKIIIKALLII